MLTIHLIFGTKGGVGTTTIAAALALLEADPVEPVLLVDGAPGRDVHAVLGLADPAHPEDLVELSADGGTGVNIAFAPTYQPDVYGAAGASLAMPINSLAGFHNVIVVDAGVCPDLPDEFEEHCTVAGDVQVIRTLVTRNDVLSLRHAAKVARRFDQFVDMIEPNRALGWQDIGSVVRGNGGRGMSITVDVNPNIARTIDAGLHGRLHSGLEIVRNLNPGAGVRQAIEADIANNS